MKNILKVFVFGIFVFFLFSNPSGVFADQEMDLHDPNTGTVKYIGHPFVVQPRIFLDGQAIDTLAMRLMHFTPARNTVSSVSIRTLFSSQVVLDNTTDNTNGTQRVDIGKVALTPDYNNTAYTPFADITFLAVDTGDGGSGVCTSENHLMNCTSTFTIDFDGSPTSSGVFLGGVNYLDQVHSLTVSLQEDSTIPVWSNCIPTNGASNVPVISNVECDFQDFQTGVYLPGTTLRVQDSFGFNDIVYHNAGGDAYSANSISNGYHLAVDPVENFPYAATITVFGSGQDNAYNNGPVLDRNTGTFVTSGLGDPYTFTTEDDVDAPEVYNRNPDDGQYGVPTDTDIKFNIHDIHHSGGYPGLGVDIDSLQVTVSASGWGTHVYTVASPELTASVLGTNTPYGEPYDYAITIDPADIFPQNTLVTVAITVGDKHSPANVLNTSYSFTTADTLPPYCEAVSPEAGSIRIAEDTPVVIKCVDSGVGVNIDSVVVQVDGIEYRRSGVDVFSYSGDSSEYLITVNPSPTWQLSYAFEVIVNASDFSGNQMNRLAYGLSTNDEGFSCPECESCSTCDDSCEDGGEQGSETSCSPEILETECETFCKSEKPCNMGTFLVSLNDMNSVKLQTINSYDANSTNIRISVTEKYLYLSGTAKPNAFVIIEIKSEPLILTTIANSNGSWKIKTRNIFDVGTHTVYALSRSLDGSIMGDKSLATFEIIPVVSKHHVSFWFWICIVPIIILLLLCVYKLLRNKNCYEEENEDKKEES